MKTSSLTSAGRTQVRHRVLLALLLLVTLHVAVLSSVPRVAAITQYKFLSSTMCKNVYPLPSKCRGETHAFNANDETAYVYFHIEMGETGPFYPGTATWYYQTDSVEHTYTWKSYDVKKGESWNFWDSISIRDDKADKRGFWRVEVSGLGGEHIFTEQFTIGPFYEVRIGVAGTPETVSVPIKVDGQPYGEIKGGESKKLGFAPGTSHKLQAKKEVMGTPGVRWFTEEDSWEFGGEGAHTFTYKEQYQLAIEISPADAVTVAGAGWYSIGATANIGQLPEVVDVDSGTRFLRKTFLDNGQVSSLPPTITMDKPHTIRLQYQKQYYLKVISDYGNPQGDGWHDAGSQTTFSVTSPYPEPGFLGFLGGTMIFESWMGDSSATSTGASLTMDGPKTVSAQWHADNTLPYIIVGGIAAAVVIIAALLVLMRRRKAPTPISAYQPPPAAEAPPVIAAPAPPRVPEGPLVRETPPVAPAEKTVVAEVKAPVRYCTNCGTEMLADALYCPTCASGTLSPASDRTLGVERLEHAAIQASVIVRHMEVKIGEDATIELQMINAGKKPATLVKIENIVPAGFELVSGPEPFRVVRDDLHLKGRRLDPMKTEEIELVLRPKRKGSFLLKPRIFYLDEDGNYRYHDPDPVTIRVKEIGLRGWVTGPE